MVGTFTLDLFSMKKTAGRKNRNEMKYFLQNECNELSVFQRVNIYIYIYIYYLSYQREVSSQSESLGHESREKGGHE